MAENDINVQNCCINSNFLIGAHFKALAGIAYNEHQTYLWLMLPQSTNTLHAYSDAIMALNR